MSDETQKVLGGALLVVIVLVMGYFLLYKPFMATNGPSQTEVAAACGGIGAGGSAAIAKWRGNGTLGLAIKMAAGMGFATCANYMRGLDSP